VASRRSLRSVSRRREEKEVSFGDTKEKMCQYVGYICILLFEDCWSLSGHE
jgi:hypothetical protein